MMTMTTTTTYISSKTQTIIEYHHKGITSYKPNSNTKKVMSKGAFWSSLDTEMEDGQRLVECSRMQEQSSRNPWAEHDTVG